MSLPRLSTLTIVCLMLPVSARAQQDQLLLGVQTELRQSAPDTNRVKILLRLGKAYLLRTGEAKSDLDSAFLYFREARNLAEVIHSPKWMEEALFCISGWYFESQQPWAGKNTRSAIIDYYKKSGNKSKEGAAWLRLGRMHRNDSTFADIIYFLEQAGSCYRETGEKEKEIGVLKEIADVHLEQGKLDDSERELLQVADMYKAIGFRNIHYTYDLLAAVSTAKGNLNRALYYGLETVKSMEATRDSGAASIFYYRLGEIYRVLDQPEQSVEWFKKAYAKMNDPYHGLAVDIISGLVKQGKPQDALTFIRDIMRKHPPVSSFDKYFVAYSLGQCYNALHQYGLAEKHYLDLARYAVVFEDNNYFRAMANFKIGEFYVSRHRYREAEPFLKKVLAIPVGKITALDLKETHLLLFKVDSAAGHYHAAIRHLQRHKLLNDSIFNETKSRQIEELQIQYETEKKEQDLKLLQNDNALQQSRLQQANLTKDISFGGGALLLVILGLLYNRFRLKQHSNRQLELQQLEINQTNRSLQNLLEEKERLLREIHHRVKNNLQIVMSLLNSQSVYLDNDAASIAIRDSQHRIHSISLIHQKLYQSENIGLIDMPVYIRELVEYLQDSFHTGKNIHFDLNIEHTALDVTQAVPIGLILNEAISNAIKYAFPANDSGSVAISMQQAGDDHFLLTISDNGVGLPADFDLDKCNSLGMSLMKGLSKQLQGSFELKSDKGVAIKVTFSNGLVLKP